MLQITRDEDKHHVSGWIVQELEECIPCFSTQSFTAFNNEDAVMVVVVMGIGL
jgi:hypothetical protein